ncbi:XRE family transcriptional regulator [Luteolibacter flavescens]|uniref:XRE family transcriptional regulator n=1 Tax=Luteolibacter flavescens TaxID=1859460 RepID=A0ABT3FTZ8_9BACT|nr:XRE family transcriptional regulator [Luteolibacter flavescens]MCW1886716.1 XRE family transcriptional regulator [Luteolibacter flavescens]
MAKILNLPLLQATLAEKGLSQTALSEALGLSKAAVSKWFKGKSFPRPQELLKLGKLLGLGFKDLVQSGPAAAEPLVAFRKRAGTVTKDEHTSRAQDMGRLLAPVVTHLPFDNFVAPVRLKDPQLDYDYIQQLVTKVRLELDLDPVKPIDFENLIGKFNELQAVLVPVMWGKKSRHENALHIYLPDSRTTWVFLNLDSELHDFKFWMAHELGHVLSVSLLEGNEIERAEDFADAFAGALLFPERAAAESLDEYSRKKTDATRIQAILRIAKDYLISPFSVYREIQRYCEHHELPFATVKQPSLHAAISQFNKRYQTIREMLFDGDVPSADHYMRISNETFSTPVFKALGDYVKATEVSPSVLSRMLDVPLWDARELKQALA